MAFKWERTTISNAQGESVAASAPVIISASRSTDVPAFHAEWFMRRLDAGYVAWKNPFNQETLYSSFEKTRAIVFWTKDPRSLMPHLDAIDRRDIGYYVQFTINDYVAEGLEPGLRSLDERISTFKALSKRLGRERVIWRFDPLILLPSLGVDALVDRVARVARELVDYTDKLVFSFVDVRAYRKVQKNLVQTTPHFTKETLDAAEPDDGDRLALAEGIASLRDRWRRGHSGFEVATCGETIDLEGYGIVHNKCIDDDLLLRLYPDDAALLRFLGVEDDDASERARAKATPVQTSLFPVDPDVGEDASRTKGAKGIKGTKGIRRKGRSLKDSGQRKACGCIFSKDIGAYNTCGHLCAYCYANTSEALVRKNLATLDVNREAILP